MDVLNRHEREMLRRIQSYLHKGGDSGGVSEQVGTVDVYFHPKARDSVMNCVTPHQGVAWVNRDDLEDGLVALERLGRTPRLIFLESLFPEAFQQQLHLSGLEYEAEQTVMVYEPLIGPAPAGETIFGRLPDDLPRDVEAHVAATWPQVELWLQVFYAAHYNSHAPAVEPEVVDALLDEIEDGHVLCVQASFQGTPLGVAQVALHDDSAEFEGVETLPLWHGMGLEVGMIMIAVRETQARDYPVIFTVQPPGEFKRLYHRLGFVSLSRVLIYKRPDDL